MNMVAQPTTANLTRFVSTAIAASVGLGIGLAGLILGVGVLLGL